jgi:hypothetical protein
VPSMARIQQGITMKTISISALCLLLFPACQTISFHPAINRENLTRYDILEENTLAKQELDINGNRLQRISANRDIIEGTTTTEYVYKYAGEASAVKSASIIIEKTENKSDGVSEIEYNKSIKLIIEGKENVYENNDSISDDYFTFALGDTYNFKNYHYAIKDKTREVVRIPYFDSGFEIEVNGKVIGYISVLNEKALYLLRNIEMPRDIYMLSMLVYKCYMLKE